MSVQFGATNYVVTNPKEPTWLAKQIKGSRAEHRQVTKAIEKRINDDFLGQQAHTLQLKPNERIAFDNEDEANQFNLAVADKMLDTRETMTADEAEEANLRKQFKNEIAKQMVKQTINLEI